MTVDWAQVDTVLLDMDGTLLDLHFDNFFWLHYLPQRYAKHHEVSLEQAHAVLTPLFEQGRGTLDWYCLDRWSSAIDMDVVQLKHDIAERITIRPHSEDFLRAVAKAGKKRLLITNAHRQSMDLKLDHSGLRSLLDITASTHDFNAAKEQAHFWPAFQKHYSLDLTRCLFLDDTLSVLKAAKKAGVGQSVMMLHPDSSKAVNKACDFPGIVHFDEIMPSAEPLQ